MMMTENRDERDRVIIFTRAYVPPALENAWLQHLRDFDVANPGCHFEVMIEVPETSFIDAIEALKITPGLTFTKIFERKRDGS